MSNTQSNISDGDMITTGLDCGKWNEATGQVEHSDKNALEVIRFLKNRNIPAVPFQYDEQSEILVPAKFRKEFAEAACDIMNEPGCLDDLDTFQGEFLTAVCTDGEFEDDELY